jgi:hypothetical protein
MGLQVYLLCVELEPRTYTVLLPMVWAVRACVIHVRRVIFLVHPKKSSNNIEYDAQKFSIS